MEHALNTDEAAIVAASQASEAVAELLRFAREGAHSQTSPFGEEVVAKLAESLKLALDIEDGLQADQATYLDDDEIEQLGNLKIAVAAFLEGWVG